MAGFFLTKGKNDRAIECAIQTFKKRGFQKYHIFSTSCGELLLYSKQLVTVENYCVLPNAAIYCVGTIVYKGKSYRESLSALLADFINKQVDESELLGSYVVIIDYRNETSILTDATGMYKLFTDQERSFLSTSFMAAAANTNCTINDLAVAEQLLYGFVSAPDTLVKEIIDINRCMDREKLTWVSWLDSGTNATYSVSDSMEKGVQLQVEQIRKYMRSVSALAVEFGAECGLSGGCDSRLIYVSTNENGCQLNSAHSHKTSRIHNKEIEVVSKLTELYHTTLNIVPTEYLLDCDPETIDWVIRENTMYFDCRNAEAIGAFSQTHTRAYKKQVANGNGLTFSGIGGEIYRDFYYSSNRHINVKNWLESRIFLPAVREIFDRQTYNDTVKRIIEKIRMCTGNAPEARFSKRYFDSYRIPQALSNVVHANNQESFFLAPFTEQQMVLAARSDEQWQDHCGEYEGKIIGAFQKAASMLMTSKGYSLSSIPASTKLKWRVRAYYPDFMWIMRNNCVHKNRQIQEKFSKALEKSNYMSVVYNDFKQSYASWNFADVENGKISLSNVIFTAASLYELKHLGNTGRI